MSRPAARARALLALLVTLAGALLLSAAPASAHAYLESSDPADGAVLQKAPRTVTLHFSESVEMRDTRIRLEDGHGHVVKIGALRKVGGDPDDTEEPMAVEVSLPDLAHDTYRLDWHTLSSDDLHATRGVLVFGVREAVTAAGVTETPPAPLESLLRWLGVASASLLAGGLVLSRLAGQGLTARRASGVAILGGVVATLAGAGLLGNQLLAVTSGARAAVLAGAASRWALTEVGLLLATAAAVLRHERLRPRDQPGWAIRVERLLLAGGACAAALGTALLGHAGAARPLSVTRVVLTAAHLLAAATWAGTLLAVVLVALLARRPGAAPDVVVPALRRFGPVAAGCLAVMTVTGLLMAAHLAESTDAVLFTVYGRVLLLKVALAGVAGLLGLVNSALLHPAAARVLARALRRPAGWQPLRRERLLRTVAAESVAALVVLGLAAVLASSQPALGPRWQRPVAAPPTMSTSRTVADLQETLSVKPNVPGRNVVSVGVYDSRRPAPGPVSAVHVLLRPASDGALVERTARRTASGEWVVTLDDLERSGEWAIDVVVQRPGMPAATGHYAWVVAQPPGTAPHVVRVSDAPISSALAMLAGGLSAAVVATLAVVWWRRSRRRFRPLVGSSPEAASVAT